MPLGEDSCEEKNSVPPERIAPEARFFSLRRRFRAAEEAPFRRRTGDLPPAEAAGGKKGGREALLPVPLDGLMRRPFTGSA